MTNGGQRRVGLVVSIVGVACVVGWLSVQAAELVVFSYDTPGVPHYHDLYVMNSNGTALTAITQSSVDKDGYPTLSPDGWVAFARFNDSNAWKGDIYKIKLDGTSLTNLTNSPGVDDWAPNWSSDGNKIVYVSGGFDIYIMNSDGSNTINLTLTPDVSEFRPSLSPDGAEIIYIACSSSGCDIIKMDTDGTGTINLTNTPELDEGITPLSWDVGWPNTSQLAWSPNGSRIAYTSLDPTTNDSDIYVMNRDGSDQTLLIPDQGAEFDPVWLHDGNLLFIRYNDESGKTEIWKYETVSGTETKFPPSESVWHPQSCLPDTPAVFRVAPSGNVYADQTFHSLVFETGAADIAEWVHITTLAEPGDVVEFDPIAPGQYCIAQDACSSLVAGVISTTPGVTLGGSLVASEKALLALIGIVPVKVTNEGGPIQPGDLLVTSSTPGHAMRWAGPDPCLCSMVGKALEPMTEEFGVILVLLTAH